MRHDVSTNIDIEAPPKAVWAELVALERHAEWNPFIISAAGTLAIGSRLDVRLRPPGRRSMRFRPRVTDLEEGVRLEWLGHLGVAGLFDGRHRFDLQPIPGGTRLEHGEHFNGLLVRALRRGLDGPTRSGFELMNEALRVRVLERRSATA